MSGYASVAVLHRSLVHHDRVFTYAIPAGLPVEVGSIVQVPLSGARTTGVVVALLAEPDVSRTMPIRSLAGPGLPAEVVALARWIAGRYLSTLGEALAAAVPQRVVAEEGAAARAVAPIGGADLSWLRGWRGAPALVRALRHGGHAGFSLQPPPGADRGAMIASLAAAVAGRGAGVLVLMPDVKAPTGVAASLAVAFGEAVASIGSDRSARDRYRAWLALRSGAVRIAAGGRAAVFAPVERLGLVVVDDEAHVSHKEKRSPRFHARTAAAERARLSGAPIVAVGVPPSVEVAAAVESARFTAVAPARAAIRERRPPVEVVDLARSRERLVPSGRAVVAARDALAAGGRVAILSHKGGDEPARIAERAVRAAGARRPARLDARTRPAEIRRALARAESSLATPVLAKDWSIDGLALLVVCHADAALSHAGFRTAEEAFGTWWRLAGFASAVLLETAQPAHPAVRALVRFDPSALASYEIARRRELGYPPFGALARVTTAPEHADALAKELERAGATVLGPMDRPGGATIAVRAPSRAALERVLAEPVRRWRAENLDTRVDVDPREVLP